MKAKLDEKIAEIIKRIKSEIIKFLLHKRIPLKLGELTTKSGVSYGTINTNDIDLLADYNTLFTMYSEMMHDLKRHNYDYGLVYQMWTNDYEELTESELFKDKDYCLRCGEAIRYHFAQQAGIEFTPKYNLDEYAKWVVNIVYIYGIWMGVDCKEYLGKLSEELKQVEDCFAKYKIIFCKVDKAC